MLLLLPNTPPAQALAYADTGRETSGHAGSTDSPTGIGEHGARHHASTPAPTGTTPLQALTVDAAKKRRGRRKLPLEARLSRMIRRADGSACWEWLSTINKYGYGTIYVDGQTLLAHRVVYSWSVGEIPAAMHVLHRCDNRKCVRPEHLFLGTNADNVADRDAKGRAARSWSARMTHDGVRAARALYATGEVRCSDLGRLFGICGWSMRKILSGKAYANVE